MGPLVSNEQPKASVDLPVPDHDCRLPPEGHALQLAIVKGDGDNLVTPLPQESHLRGEDLILAAGLLVMIVEDEYPHPKATSLL